MADEACLQLVLREVPLADLFARVPRACKLWKRVSESEMLWEFLCREKLGSPERGDGEDWRSRGTRRYKAVLIALDALCGALHQVRYDSFGALASKTLPIPCVTRDWDRFAERWMRRFDSDGAARRALSEIASSPPVHAWRDAEGLFDEFKGVVDRAFRELGFQPASTIGPPGSHSRTVRSIVDGLAFFDVPARARVGVLASEERRAARERERLDPSIRDRRLSDWRELREKRKRVRALMRGADPGDPD